MSTRISTDAVDELPPSAKYVLDVIGRTDGPVRRDELITTTGLKEPTLDRALDRLEDLGVVRRDRVGNDLRCVQVEICERS